MKSNSWAVKWAVYRFNKFSILFKKDSRKLEQIQRAVMKIMKDTGSNFLESRFEGVGKV